MNAVKTIIEDAPDAPQADARNTAITTIRLFTVDFLLLSASFFVCYFFKQGGFALSAKYEVLIGLFYLCWLVASLIGKKFQTQTYACFWKAIFVFFNSGLYLLYAISFLVVFQGLVGYSRVHIFSTCLVLVVFEIVVWAGFYRIAVGRIPLDPDQRQWNRHARNPADQLSYTLLGVDLFLVFVSFFIINFFKRGGPVLPPEYDKLLLIIVGLWFFASMITKKFHINTHLNYYFNLWQWLKAGFLMMAFTSVFIFGFRLFHYSRFQGFGTVLLLMLMEMILITLYFWRKKGKTSTKDIESIEAVKTILGQEVLPQAIDIEKIRQKLMEPARINLENKLSWQYPDLFEFIAEHIDLDEMIRLETTIEYSCDPNRVHTDEIPARLFLNLHKINDIRLLNQYFLKVYQSLMPGGYFVGEAHTIRTHREWVYDKFPRLLAHFIYTLDFCYNRVMPKLPWLKNVYFALTKGKNRIISKTEVMGRLYFCGFEIVAEREINKRFCFIARKVKTPSLDTSPTYGPIVTLKRSGFNGKVVHIYKFRTMHPYSEYLQQYVYKLQGLQKGGKLEDDFRVTEWGKFMRKYWLDELPMIYNWLKGDLQIVGVRPLSFHYLSLYDEELTKLRTFVKPGLVPPFYADLPETFDEICDSERRYIQAFLKKPITTQAIYFWKSFVNIAFKGARSG